MPLPPPLVDKPRDPVVEQRRLQAQNHATLARLQEAQKHKRKAEDGLAGRDSKTMRNSVSSGQVPRAIRPIIPPERPSRPAVSVSSASSISAAMPYHGTSRPDPASTTPITPTGDASKAPKKGSYAEIMARAKANQSKPPVGTISHKPKEQIAPSYKKELKLKEKATKNKKLGIKDNSRPGSSGSLSSSSPAPRSIVNKKIAAAAYKSTAKPKPQLPHPTYKGTMKSASSTTKTPDARPRDAHPRKPRYDDYAATDEDELDDIEEDGEEEEDDYGSDASDDMEAGFTDVEQEETVAEKAARKEDEEQLRLEAKLKKEKTEAKKKMLEQLAKKAKPQRY